MEHIASVLERKLRKEKLLEKKVLYALRQQWQCLMEESAAGTEPVALYGRNLLVRCDHPCYAVDVSMRSESLIAFVRRMGYESCSRVRIRVGCEKL